MIARTPPERLPPCDKLHRAPAGLQVALDHFTAVRILADLVFRLEVARHDPARLEPGRTGHTTVRPLVKPLAVAVLDVCGRLAGEASSELQILQGLDLHRPGDLPLDAESGDPERLELRTELVHQVEEGVLQVGTIVES